MKIGQVRQLVLDWGYGTLPEQQVEGAAEIRKELEVLEKELVEREAELDRRLSLLFEQAEEDKEKNVSIYLKEREELDKCLRTPGFPQEEYDKLVKEYSGRHSLRLKRVEELWEAYEKGQSVHSQEVSKLQSEFSEKATPLRERVIPDTSVKTFYKVFGKPKDKSLIGDNYYFQYRCKDGLVVLEIYASYFDIDSVVIRDVSVL
jgi:hypothetical protein